MRGQAHTLEAVTAGVVLLASLVFAMQVTAVTPLSASTSSQHIENQQLATTEGVLDAAAANGSLVRAVGHWNESGASGVGTFHGRPEDTPFRTANEIDNTELGRLLLDAFDGRGVAFNVYVAWQNDDDYEREPFVYRGEPSDNAVTASRVVTLYDDDPLYEADGTPDSTNTVGNTGNFYVRYDAPTGVYNVLRVEVVVWRM